MITSATSNLTMWLFWLTRAECWCSSFTVKPLNNLTWRVSIFCTSFFIWSLTRMKSSESGTNSSKGMLSAARTGSSRYVIMYGTRFLMPYAWDSDSWGLEELLGAGDCTQPQHKPYEETAGRYVCIVYHPLFTNTEHTPYIYIFFSNKGRNSRVNTY